MSDERIWEALLTEFEWLYAQMDRGLRARLAPVFVLFELKTVVLCLRNRAAQRLGDIEGLLARSLLSAPLQQALRQERDLRSAVAAVTEILAGAAPRLRESAQAFADHGLRGFEDSLMRSWLAYVATVPLHPVVRWFFGAFIDLRNVMILYKELRWELDEAAAFIPGGTIDVLRFERLLARRELACVDEAVREATGLGTVPAAASEGALETVLLASLTRRLRQAGREDEDVGLVLDYLWRNYVQARNLAVLYHGRDLAASTLERELVA